MNDDFLKQFRKPARKSFARQLHQRLVEKQREKLLRSNHTHKEKKDMNRTIALPRDEGPYSGLLTLAVAAMAALALAFIIMLGYTSNNTIFTGMFQDTEQHQRDAVRVYINQAWNAGDTDRLNDLLTDDHITTTTLFGTVEGVEGVAGLINAYRTAIPDFLYTIDTLEIDGDTVWVRGTITGTHTGTFILPDGTEIPPSGSAITIDSAIMFRFVDGDIAEINQIDNTQDLMEQMSAAQSVEEVANEVRNATSFTLGVQYVYGGLPGNVTLEKLRAIYPSGSFPFHYRHGDGVFSIPPPGSLTFPGMGGKYIDDGLTIHNITATGEFVAIEFEFVSLVQGPNTVSSDTPREELIPTYNIQIAHLEDGKIAEVWEYADGPLGAPSDYGWAEPGE